MFLFLRKSNNATTIGKRKQLSIDSLEMRHVLTAVFQVVQDLPAIYETGTDRAERIDNIQLVDIDNDSDQDILVSVEGGVAWLQNLDGKGDFDAPAELTRPSGGVSQLGDLDQDGDIDIWSQAGWYPNEGQGQFGDFIQVAPTQDIRNAILADLNGDGSLDIVSSRDRKVEWRQNLGTGEFADVVEIGVASAAVNDVAVADIDGDGDLDVGVASTTEVLLFDNLGNADAFDEVTAIIQPEGDIRSIVFDDIDGDDDQDLIINAHVPVDFHNPNSIRRVLENTGSGSFTQVQELFVMETTIASFDEMAMYDLDADGDRELISISGHCWFTCLYGKFSVFENVDAEVRFDTPIHVDRTGRDDPISETADTSIAVGDVDSDGFPDIITLSREPAEGFEGNGWPRWFQRINRFKVVPAVDVAITTDVAMQQIPGGSNLTYAVEVENNWDREIVDAPFNFDFNVPVGDISWTCEATLNSQCGSEGIGERIADTVSIQPRGRLTYRAVVSVPGEHEGRLIGQARLQTSSHTFQASIENLVRPASHPFRTATGVFSSDVDLFMVSSYEYIHFADLDGDGDVDGLAIESFDNDRVVRLTNDGIGHFDRSHVLPNSESDSGGFEDLMVIDIDSDGDTDFLVSLATAPDFDIRVQLFLNDGAGNFAGANTFDTYSYDIGDLHGDGYLDIVDGEQKWFNNGDGTFTDGVPLLSEATPDRFFSQLADLNDDAFIDLVIFKGGGARSYESWINDGSGEFTLLGELPLADDQGLLAIQDVDGDGRDDAILYRGTAPWPWQFPYEHSIHWNDGTGRFVEPVVLPTQGRYQPADFDADGDVDLLAFDQNDQVFIIKNNGDRTFNVGPQPQSVRNYETAFVDIDGDHDIDIVASSGYDSFDDNGDGRLDRIEPVIGTRIMRQVEAETDALSISIQNIPEQLYLGERFGFDIVATNSGDEGMAAAAITSSFEMLSDVVWSCSPGQESSCSSSGDTVIADTAMLGPGESLTYHVSAKAPDAAAVSLKAELATQPWLFFDRDLANNATATSIEVLNTRLPGDSNGDGYFDSSDLVLIFQAGKYEDDISANASFEEGDWNGDGDFDTADLVFAFQAGRYITSRPAIAMVGTATNPFAEPFPDAPKFSYH